MIDYQIFPEVIPIDDDDYDDVVVEDKGDTDSVPAHVSTFFISSHTKE